MKQNKIEAMQIFFNSRRPNTKFYFAYAGITITRKLLTTLMPPSNSTEDTINLDKHILPYLGKLKSDADFLLLVNHLYKQFFILFNETWSKSQPTYIEHFD